jgi:hypothetical protein
MAASNKDGDFLTDPGLQCAVMLEMIKIADKGVNLDRELFSYFWHFYNSDFSSSVSLHPDDGDSNSELSSRSDEYTEGVEISFGQPDQTSAAHRISVALAATNGFVLDDNGGMDNFGNAFVTFTPTGDATTGALFFPEIEDIFERHADDVLLLVPPTKAIDTLECNPFYQMTRILQRLDTAATSRASNFGGEYWREYELTAPPPNAGAVGSPISTRTKVTRRGALDIKALAFLVYKIYQKLLVDSVFTGSKSNDDGALLVAGEGKSPTIGDKQFLVYINPGSATNALNYTNEILNNIQNTETGAVQSYGKFKSALENEDKRYRSTMSYIDQCRISDAKNELDKLVDPGADPKIPATIEALKLPTPGYELDMVKQIDQGQVKLAELSKLRQLPNLKVSAENIGENNPDSLLPNSQIFSTGTKNALLNLMNDPKIKDTFDSEFDPKNSKIFTIALPSGFIETNRFKGVAPGDLTSAYQVKPRLNPLASLMNVKIEKNDALLQGVDFIPLTLLFDSCLYIAPNGFDSCQFVEDSPSILNEIIENRIRFSRIGHVTATSIKSDILNSPINDIDSDGFNEHGLLYDDIIGLEEYQDLTTSEIQSVLLNCTVSDLLKRYVQLIVGVKVAEEEFAITEKMLEQYVDDNVSGLDITTFLSNAQNIDGLNIPIDPSLISTLLSNSGILVQSSDTSTTTTKKVPNSADNSIDGLSTYELQQFNQLLTSATFKPNILISEIVSPKRFENIFFVIVDPDEFVVDEVSTNSDLIDNLKTIGLAQESLIDNKLRIIRKQEDSSYSNINEFYISANIHDTPQG